MIADILSNLGRYKGLHPNLDTAIDYLLCHPLDNLPDGRIDIDGDKVFLTIQTPEFRQHDGYEKHAKYMDIQIALAEGESICYLPENTFSSWNDENAANDFYLQNDKNLGACFEMKKGNFVIFFPHEPHKPGLGHQKGRKAVVKVLID
jgi:YhcH/YjgK/YiaL family protein